MIRTWQERCEDFDDSHITTHQDIKNMMMEEIEELRAALIEAKAVNMMLHQNMKMLTRAK